MHHTFYCNDSATDVSDLLFNVLLPIRNKCALVSDTENDTMFQIIPYAVTNSFACKNASNQLHGAESSMRN
jgi:hypothetical protein